MVFLISGDSPISRLELGTLNYMGYENAQKIEEINARSQQCWTLSDLHALIDDSRSTGHGFLICTREYPTGDVEAVAVQKSADDSLRARGGKRKNKERSQMDEETLRRSQGRARKILAQKCLCLQADRMLTLTYRENKTDLEECWKDFQRFSRKCKKSYGERWRYVCVPEYQKRGAVHFHLAISGYFNVNHIRAIWHSIVGKGMGNIDITSPSRAGKNSWNPKCIAHYLAKYLTKTETVEFNQRRYSSGGQIPEPKKRIGWLSLGVSVPQVLHDLVGTLSHAPIVSYWESEEWGVFMVST